MIMIIIIQFPTHPPHRNHVHPPQRDTVSSLLSVRRGSSRPFLLLASIFYPFSCSPSLLASSGKEVCQVILMAQDGARHPIIGSMALRIGPAPAAVLLAAFFPLLGSSFVLSDHRSASMSGLACDAFLLHHQWVHRLPHFSLHSFGN